MRKNSVFWGMLCLSAALHGFAIIGMTEIGFRSPSPLSEAPLVSTIKMIKAGIRPPATASSPPSLPNKPVEKKTVKEPAEPEPELPPEIPAVEETAHSGEMREETGTEAVTEGADSGEVPESGAAEDGIKDGGTITDREYEALLAYIKDFIDKNLVYPQMARRRNIEGVVAVRFEIGASGAIGFVVVDRSSGSSLLDNAAVSLIEKIHPPANLTLNRTLALNVNITYELTE
jgi:TonB family protein